MKSSNRKKKALASGVLSFVIFLAAIFMMISPSYNNLNMVINSDESRGGNLFRNSVLTEADGSGSYDLTIPYIGLEKGSYNADFEYIVTEPVDINIWCTSEYDTETKEFPVIYLGTLTPEKTQDEFTFTFDRDVKQFMLKLEYEGKGTAEVKSCVISEENLYRNREISSVVLAVALAVFVAFAVYGFMDESSDRKQKLFCTAVIATIVISCSIGLLEYDVMIGDDMEFHLTRIMGIAENISRGMPFNKINPAFNGGYGYLNPVFYPELFLYIPAMFMVWGANVTVAYRLFIFIINIATALISYICFGKVSENRYAGLVAAAIYTLNHYRMRDIFARAALGELLYMTFLPIVIYGIYLIFHKHEKKWPVLMLGATLVFQSHILGTVLTACAGAFFIVMYLIHHIVKKENVLPPIVAIIKAGIGVVAVNLFFLVPMLYYIRHDFSMFGHADYVRLFKSMARSITTILFSFRNQSYATLYARFGLTAGIVFAAMFVAAVVFAVKKRGKGCSDVVISFVSAAFFLVCASTLMPWDILAEIGIVELFMSKMQFCFRFVSLFAVFAAMGAAVLLKEVKYGRKNIALIALAVILTASGVCYHFVDGCQTRGFDGDYCVVVDSPPEYFMKNAAYHVDKVAKSKFTASSEQVQVKDYERTGGGLRITVDSTSQQEEWLDVPLLYYAQYGAQDMQTGAALEVSAGERFVIRVAVPAEMAGDILVKYQYPLFFTAANAVSALSAAAFVLYVLIKRKRESIR